MSAAITASRPRHSLAVLAATALVAVAMLLGVTDRPAGAAAFSNPGSIAVGPSAGASPISVIDVSGQPTVTTGVSVTLNDFQHSQTYDVDVLLEGPSGVRVMLMSDVHAESGGCVTNSNTFDFTFADSAAGPMGVPFADGTYQPTDFDDANCDDTGDDLVGPTTATMLSEFIGTNPNGTWTLHVADDKSAVYFGSGGGTIAGGWTLNIESENPTPAPEPAPTPLCDGSEATIPGTPGDDVLVGTSGPDVIAGLGGNDKLIGLGGNDIICGGAGNDKLKGKTGADRMLGGPGDDTCRGGAGRDRASNCETVRSL